MIKRLNKKALQNELKDFLNKGVSGDLSVKELNESAITNNCSINDLLEWEFWRYYVLNDYSSPALHEYAFERMEMMNYKIDYNQCGNRLDLVEA